MSDLRTANMEDLHEAAEYHWDFAARLHDDDPAAPYHLLAAEALALIADGREMGAFGRTRVMASVVHPIEREQADRALLRRLAGEP